MIRPTPVLAHRLLDDETGLRCFLKAENLQETGAFKVRGAFAAMSAGARRDVVTASAGNFGQGIAYAARCLGCEALVVVPKGTPRIKVLRIERLGARIRIAGNDFDEADAVARRLALEEGLQFISAFDDLRVIEGQATLGLEVLAEVPDLEALVVPCGGGGLLAGITLVARSINPHIRLVAVEPSSMPSLGAALAAGRPRRLPAKATIADGIAVRKIGRQPLEVIRNRLHGVVTVSERELAEAIRFLALELKQIVEGAGAAALACVLKRPALLEGCRSVGVLVTGGNIDPGTLAEVLSGGVERAGDSGPRSR